MNINPYMQIAVAKHKATAIDPLDYYRSMAQQAEPVPEENADSAGIVERVWHTGEGAVKSLARGAIDSVEGIADLGLGVVGGVGGIFSPKFRKLMKDVVEYDAVQEWIFDPLDDIAENVRGSRIGEYSYIKEGSLPDMVIEGVGGMLPAVAISIATAGFGAPAAAAGTAGTVAKVGGIAGKVGLSAAKAAKVAQVASMATMAAGAAGQATEEAYRDGAGYYGGLGYGIARGAVEAGTEYALGGFTKGLTGGGKLLPGVRQSVVPTGVKRVIKNAVEEGLEEMISEASDPATRTIYQGPEALKKYLDPETYKQIGQAGIVGTATGGVFQGTIGHALGNSGRAADMQEITQELDTLKEKKRNLGKNNKLTDEAYAAISEAERENYRVMETVLQKATPEKRAALMENYRLSDKFTEDGTMKADFVASLDRKATVGQMAANAENGAPAGSVTGRAVLDRRTASVDADAEQVAKVLAKEGRTQFTDVDSLSKEGQKNLRNVKRVMDVFHDISDGAVGEFVIANESVGDNAYYDPETGYIVIGADALEKGIDTTRKGVQSWFQTVLHEAAHGGEGPDSHVKLSAILRHIGGGKYYTEMLKQLGSRGYWNGKASDIRAEVEKIIRKVERGEALTDKQTALANVIASEGTSIMAEQALGNAHFARELLDADASVVEKLLHRIEDVKEALALRKDAAAKEAFEEVRKAEQMFLDALAEKGMRFEGGKIVGSGENDEEEIKRARGIDKRKKEGYNRKKKYKPFDDSYFMNVHSWLNKPTTQPNDYNYLYDSKRNTWKIIIAESKEDYTELYSFVNYDDGKELFDQLVEEAKNESHRSESQDGESFYESALEYERERGYYLDYLHDASGRGTDGRSVSVFEKESSSEGERDSGRDNQNQGAESSVKKSRKANSQTSGKTPTWEKAPPTKKYLGVDATERVAIIDDRAYGTTNITKAIDNVIAALQMEIDESVEVPENKELVVKLSEWKKSSSVNELINKLKEAKTPQEQDAALDAVIDTVMADAYVKTIISNESLTRAVETVNRLKQYRRKIDLTQTGVSKPIYQKWGKKDGIPLAEVMEDLPTAVRLTNPEDMIAVMQDVDKAYEEVRQYIRINKSHKIQYFMGEADEALLRERMKDAFKADLTAKASAEAVERLEEQYHKQLDRATNVYNFSHRMNTIFKLSLDMRDIKAGRFLNQSQPENHNILNRTLGQLCRVMNGGSLNKSCRKYFREAYEWYVNDAKKYLKFDPKTNQGEYSPEIAEKLQRIGFSESDSFTVEELGDIINICQYFKHMAENYQKVWRNGKLVEAQPYATELVKISKDNLKLNSGKMNHIIGSAYMRMYGDPHMLVKYMDKYKLGFYTTMFERIREGTVQSQIIMKRMNDKINEALEDPKRKEKREEKNRQRGGDAREPAARNTKYFESLSKRTIHLHGADMPVGEAISLYMTCNREQAKAGLLENGYSFAGEDDGKNEHIRRVFGFTGGEKVRDKQGRIKPEYQQKITDMQNEIYAQLSELDKKFIAVAQDILQNDCKDLKRATDLALNGWSNAAEEYYFPIRRYETFKSIDKEGFFGEVDRVTNASFNKNTQPGAKNQLMIESIDVVLNRHMKGVAKYAALGQVIRDYDTLRTLDVSGNPNAAVSIATVETEEGGWHQGTEYFYKLLSDVQGIKSGDTDEVTKVIGKVRGNYARFALAANPKVVMTQLSSIFAGMNIIDADCMLKGFSDRGRDVFTYSKLAELRASENTAAMAQGLIDEAGDVLMKPIGWMDSYVVRRLWVAAQHQVAKDQKLKVGTEENKKAAGKLLETVIFETQQNSLATEKSQAARSSSEFQKMVTMFTSDAVKGMGQLLDAFGEVSVIRREAKINGTAVDSVRLKAAEKRLGRAAASLAAVAIYTTILSQLFRKLLKKEDEEEPWSGFMADTMGAMLGGLPLISDAYEYFFGSGYGLEDMSIAAINDLLDGIKSLFGTAGAFVTGDLDERDLHKDLRQMLFALGQVTGLPTRNLYNYARAAVHWVSPETGYRMDDSMSVQPYRSDIAKAIEAEDEGRLETVIGVMLDENVGEVTSSAVRQELKRLVTNGMDVLPRGVGDTVTVDGEAVKLTAKQQKAFKSVYAEANKSVERMVGLAYYANASDEAKAKAIKRVYGIYYNRAIEDLLGVELENKNTLLSHAIDPEVLAVVLAICGEITADKDAGGKAIAGSKRRKIEDFVESLKLKAAQKYIIMGALGYKNKLGEAKVKAYVNGLGLSKNEREALMGYSGY